MLDKYIDNIHLLRQDIQYRKVKTLISEAKRLVFLGCGGSFCGHMCHDYLKVLGKPTLSPDSPSLLSCLFNDYPKEDAYREWLKVQAQPGDLLIVVSSSGRSDVTINAAKYFKTVGPVVTFTAFDDSNPLKHIGDINVYFPIRDYGIHEVYTEMFLHAILDELVEAEDELWRT